MLFRSPRRLILAALAALVLVAGIAFYFVHHAPTPEAPSAPEAATTTPVVSTIGTSVEGRAIRAYTYGTGPTHLLFVGGMHGGYEWNSVLLAYQAMDYLAANPNVLPSGLSVTIVPDANPDAVFLATGKEGRFTAADVPSDKTSLAAARFNADDVDLNRNFACHWAPESTWQGRTVSAGTAAFSEPEAAAIRDLVAAIKPIAVVFWHSQAGAVYASECDNGVLPGTFALMNAYAKAADYPAVESFNAYPITGDSEGWLASIGIPAVTVELSSHDSIQWDKNRAGMQALFALYGTSAVSR